MRKLYLFNPDTDLALGNDSPFYMAPKSAKYLAHDLALLPIWYGDRGSLVLAKTAINENFMNVISSRFSLDFDLVDNFDLSGLTDTALSPWGWNRALLNEMALLKYPPTGLINDEYLKKLRLLSHRSTAVKLLQAIPKANNMCGFSFVLDSIADLKSIAPKLGPILLKAPISGSGKGLRWCREGVEGTSINWAKRILKSQGSLVVEPIYNKVRDFAMEFCVAEEGSVDFVGYSDFTTNLNGSYSGNRLLPDRLFEDEINYKYFDYGFLGRLREVLNPLLLGTVGRDYRGYFGVDMMVCRFDAPPYYRLHPCVEINMRVNMGVVAHTFYRRHVSQNAQGIYGIYYMKNRGDLLLKSVEMEKRYPLRIASDGIVSGFLGLTPVTQESKYLAWVLIG